ncbi:MAG: hypothetical protein U0X20_00295 [Caldilineaceae bacterium]
MSSLHPVLSGLTQPTSLRLCPGSATAIVLQRNGTLIEVNLASGQSTPVGKVPVSARSLDLGDDGQTAFVAGQNTLWQLSLGGQPTKLLGRGSFFGAIHASADLDGLFVAEARVGGRLLFIGRSSLRVETWARNLKSPRALLAERTPGRVFFAETAGGGQVFSVTEGSPPVLVATDMGAPLDMAWRADSQPLLLVADAAGGRILQLDLTQPAAPAVILASGIAGLYAVQAMSPDELVIGADDGVWRVDLTPIPVPSVELVFPNEPLFIAGWVKVPVKINDPAIAFNDLDFYIKPEESAAMVSLSRDNSFDPANPDIMVTAGWMAGEHVLIAEHRPTGSTVGEVKFEVTDTWLDTKRGPSLSVLGSIEAGPTAGTWGGGDFTHPQNSAVVPALGTRNVAVVLVDTADARYPTGPALTSILDGFRDEMVNGVVVNGQTRSVAAYFDQASNGAFALNVTGVVGTVSLPGNWTTYFAGTPKDSDGDGVNDWTMWSYSNSFAATVIANIVQLNQNAGAVGNPPFLDLSALDSVVMVVRTVPAAGTTQARFAWPRANLGPETHLIGFTTPWGVVLPLFRPIAAVVMPDDWETQPLSGRRWHETVAHELGHNLQLNDQYFNAAAHDPSLKPRIADDNPGNSWEVMSWEENLPLPSAAHRLMLSWLNPSWIKLFNFGVFGPVDETITLHATSAGAPPPGRFAAAEVRIADGRNYYFEYRAPTAGRIVDSTPPAAVTVFGSDVTSRGNTPANRPEILRLRDDSDADHAEFQAGDDYEEVDTTSPQFPNDFVVNVLSTTADSATIRVRYGLDQEPDPALMPWSASTNWQSPDIEVINARSLADPAFRNIPWEGHDNTVIARVTNRGQIPATGVRVRFGAKDFTFAGGAESPLGDRVQDVTNGATVDFTAPAIWRPTHLQLPFFQFWYQQHACLVARIDPYINGTIVEVTPDNNEAQSNYTWLATSTASPASREVNVIKAHNPFSVPAFVSFEIHQPHPLFRVYLSQRWAYLEPGAEAPILVMMESLLGDPKFDPAVREFANQDARIMTTLRLSALGDTGEACAPVVLGGVSLLAMTGRATRFEKFVSDGRVASGFVVAVETGKGVDGNVLVTLRPRDADDKRSEIARTAVAVDGWFKIELAVANDNLPDTIVQGHYLGNFRFTACDSDVVPL